jgi:hypothetical protein
MGYMPADYTIDAARQFVYSRGWGVLTDEDLLDHQQRLALDPRFHSHFCQLIDFLGVTSVDAVTANGVRAVARRHLYGPGARRAIVAPDLALFGLARMFESHRDAGGGEEQIRVFKSLGDAWAWLGRSPPKNPKT